MLIQIQAKKGTSIEVLHELEEQGVANEIIELGETQQIRVCVEDWESDVSIRVGQLELIPTNPRMRMYCSFRVATYQKMH